MRLEKGAFSTVTLTSDSMRTNSIKVISSLLYPLKWDNTTKTLGAYF